MGNHDSIHNVPGKTSLVHPLSSLLFFAWILAVQLTGLGIFTKGFFLTRVELGKQSTCDVTSLLDKDELKDLSDTGRQGSGGKRAILDENGCWLPPRFKRMVWVVIDALRYDFAAFTPEEEAKRPSSQPPGARYYLNHLPVVQEAIGETGSSEFDGTGGMLFQFEADPPTVTMQRLKGLTTGGLPTFIDFRDNFHSPEIEEDNWVAQIGSRAVRRAGKSSGGNGRRRELVFMGDDTWTSLYPTYFKRSFPFPSFNTRDLHTVDDGVIDHLSDELAKDDWVVLVAHFLGVDHVGHTFGPASPAMAAKLDQMDKALRTVFSSVDDDTLVFVLGDHGMTQDGNHGGATPDETGAALLIWSRSREQLLGPKRSQYSDYSPDGVDRTELRARGIWEDLLGEQGDAELSNPYTRKVAQIDLVPTLSLLLGTPIPYGNLGGIIPEVFMGSYELTSEDSSRDDGNGRSAEGLDPEAAITDDDVRFYERLSDALLVNSLQVWRYLVEYAKVASMPAADMLDLESKLTNARDVHKMWRKLKSKGLALGPRGSAEHLHEVCRSYKKFLDAAIGLGRSLWTQYDTGLMGWGLAVLLLATLVLGLRLLVGEDVRAAAEVASGGASRWGAGHYGLVWGAAGTAGAILTQVVFRASSLHVLLAISACSSCLGVCWFYLEAVLLHPSGLAGDLEESSRHAGLRPRSLMGKVGFGRTSVNDGTNVVLTTSAPMALAAFYCAGLFSNSFIEAEDQLHRFLGASSLLALAAVQALSTNSCLSKLGASGAMMRPMQSMAEAGSNATASRDTGTRDAVIAEPFLSRLCTEPSTAMWGAAVYAAIAAACLRAAAAMQDASLAVVGLAPGAAFGVFRSLVPLVGLWCLCCIGCGGGDALVAMTGWTRGERPADKWISSPRGSVRSIEWPSWVLHALLQAVSFVAIGAYWIVETIATEAHPGGGDKGSNKEASMPTRPALHSDDGKLFGLARPARLMLPRVTYAVCVAGLLLLAVVGLARRPGVDGRKVASPPGEDDGTMMARSARGKRRGDHQGIGRGDVEACATIVAIVITHMAPVVVLLLGPGSPLVVLLMAMACACVLRSLSISAEMGTALPLATVAVTWSIVGRTVFFLTGHHNQFSRLQYSAAFVGFEEFDFHVGGVLLFINTFGTEIVAAFTLPLAAAAVVKPLKARLKPADGHGKGQSGDGGLSAPPSTEQGVHADLRVGEDGLGVSPTRESGIKDTHGEGLAWQDVRDRGHASVANFMSVMDRLSGLTLLLSGARTVLSTANVSVQRGHLMLWAIFAPKFIFDATMQVVSGGAAVVVWAVVLASLRAVTSGNGRASHLRASHGGTPPTFDGPRSKDDNSHSAVVLDSSLDSSFPGPGGGVGDPAPSMRLRRV